MLRSTKYWNLDPNWHSDLHRNSPRHPTSDLTGLLCILYLKVHSGCLGGAFMIDVDLMLRYWVLHRIENDNLILDQNVEGKSGRLVRETKQAI
jgi:hypothetical protein